MAGSREKVQRYTPAAKLDNFLKGFAEGRNKRLELEMQQRKMNQAKSADMKDMMIMSLFQQMDRLPSGGGQAQAPSQQTQQQIGGVQSQVAGGRAPIGIGQGQQAPIGNLRSPEVKSLYEESIARGVSADAFNNKLKTMGFKLSAGQEKQLALSYNVQLENATREGKVKTGQAMADIEVGKQVAGQAGKAAQTAGVTFQGSATAGDTAFDTMLNFHEVQLEKFKTKPGEAFGLIDKMTPKQLNSYKAAAEGAGVEAAALVGRSLIPQVRAVAITKIFRESTAEIGNTIEGNAANIAASQRNSLAQAMNQNASVQSEGGEMVNINDLIVDEKTGKKMSELSFEDAVRAKRDFLRKWEKEVNDRYIMQAHKRNPKLLQESTLKKLNKKDVLVAELDKAIFGSGV